MREKACMLESEEARKFVLEKWQKKERAYLEINYPCPDCRVVNDVLIEQNTTGEWQITIWPEPDEQNPRTLKESVAVTLKRRRATEYDFEKHVVGELILVFENAVGNEILTL